MLSGCAGSAVSVDVAAVQIGNLPPSVYAEASRVTAISVKRLETCASAIGREKPVADVKPGDVDRCKLTGSEVKRLLVALRRSELRKVAALRAAVAQRDRERKALAARGKKA